MPDAFDDVRLVCFDLGRVLVKLVQDREDAARRAAVVLPRITAEQFHRIEQVRDAHEAGRLTFDQFASRCGEISGLTPAEHHRIAEAWLCGMFDGVPDMIDRINARCATACLSNTNDLHWRMMTEGDGPNRLPLERLTWRFASHIIGALKPDAAIYEHVERQTGFAAGQIVFFDDHGPNVEAASQRGWRAFQILPQREPVAQIDEHLAALKLL
jgi:FMN phosphatase YigB (HAD superfamily)